MTSEIKYSRGKCLQSTTVKFHPWAASFLPSLINPPYTVCDGTICNRRLFAPPYSNYFLRTVLNSFCMMMKLKTD